MMFLYSLMWMETSSLLVMALVLMFLARLAYLRLLMVSSNCEEAGLMFEIITVLQLPPRLSFSSRVSLESRYGTKNPFLFLSPSAFMQLASASSERFIFAPYISRSPRFSVTVPRSEPARSMRDSLPDSVSTLMALTRDFLAMLIWKTAWLREEVRLALVA
jgi:hypothetical protein